MILTLHSQKQCTCSYNITVFTMSFIYMYIHFNFILYTHRTTCIIICVTYEVENYLLSVWTCCSRFVITLVCLFICSNISQWKYVEAKPKKQFTSASKAPISLSWKKACHNNIAKCNFSFYTHNSANDPDPACVIYSAQ